MSAEMIKRRMFGTTASIGGEPWCAIEAKSMSTMDAFLQFVRSSNVGWVIPPREEDLHIVLFNPEVPSPEVICKAVDGPAVVLPASQLSHLGKRIQIIANPQAGLAGAQVNRCATDLAGVDVYGTALVLTGSACVNVEDDHE